MAERFLINVKLFISLSLFVVLFYFDITTSIILIIQTYVHEMRDAG